MSFPSLTIVEGPDGSGKSTLVARLAESYGATVVHHGPYKGEKNIAWRYLESFGNETGHVILDRSWLSEPIYRRALRERDRIASWERRLLTRAALAFTPVVVLALPSYDVCEANCRARDKDAYLLKDNRLRTVYAGYLDMMPLLRASVDVPMTFVRYDYKLHNIDDITRWIDPRRRKLNPGPGIGNWSPGRVILMVGERPGTSARTPNDPHLPFVGWGGVVPWFAELFENWRLNELDFYWVNAFDRNDVETPGDFVRELRPRAVVALGQVARAWCDRHGVERRVVPHPQFWRRFHYREPSTSYPLFKTITTVMRDVA